MSIDAEPSKEVGDLFSKVAVEAAVAASKLVLKYWPNPNNSHFDRSLLNEQLEKSEGVANWATKADFESERVITEIFKKSPHLGGIRIIGEEETNIGTISPWRVYVDPVDGTPPFDAGLRMFGICIGVYNDKTGVVGVVALPGEGEILVGIKNRGIQVLDLDGKPKRTFTNRAVLQDVSDLGRGLVAYDLGYEERGEQLEKIVARVARNIGSYPSCYASMSYAGSMLAQGALRGFFALKPQLWDVAAVDIIVREAGGESSDFNGNTLDWTKPLVNGYVSAPTSELHRQFVQNFKGLDQSS